MVTAWEKLFSSHEESTAAWKLHIFQFHVLMCAWGLGSLWLWVPFWRKTIWKDWVPQQPSKLRLWSLDAQTRRQKRDRHCFWKLPCFLFEVFPQINSSPTNSHTIPPSNKQNPKPYRETTPHLPHTQKHTNNQESNSKPKNMENVQILSQVCYTLLHGEGIFKVKCIFTILELIIFPFLTANIINQFIHSITLKCMHWQEITEHTLIIAIIIMTQIQQSN